MKSDKPDLKMQTKNTSVDHLIEEWPLPFTDNGKNIVGELWIRLTIDRETMIPLSWEVYVRS